MDYSEAQEIATTGEQGPAPPLHPGGPESGIPIHILSTAAPHQPGTVIGPVGDLGSAQVKAISRKTGVVLVSMETVGMWQEGGLSGPGL